MWTLNEGQGHPNWYQNVEVSGPYHYTKFWKKSYCECLEYMHNLKAFWNSQ